MLSLSWQNCCFAKKDQHHFNAEYSLGDSFCFNSKYLCMLGVKFTPNSRPMICIFSFTLVHPLHFFCQRLKWHSFTRTVRWMLWQLLRQLLIWTIIYQCGWLLHLFNSKSEFLNLKAFDFFSLNLIFDENLVFLFFIL